jgi:hypothetical protein
VFATLAEIYALLGLEEKYKENRDKARKILDEEGLQSSFGVRERSEAALERAETRIERKERGTKGREANAGEGAGIL